MTASFIPSILDELDDVIITSPLAGQVQRFNGTNWVNAVLAHADLSGIGANTHTQIDTHLASTSSPHGAVLTQTTLNVTNLNIPQNTWIAAPPTNVLRETYFGLSTAYRVIQIGAGISVSIGVDTSVIAGGNFGGSSEFVVPNIFVIRQVNLAGTNFLPVIIFNDANIILANSRYYGLLDFSDVSRIVISAAQNLLVVGDGNGGWTGIAFRPGGNETIRFTNNGSVGIGTSAPTAVLHLKAGTAAANTAPLKLMAGINLTTPENGAFEYDGTNLYFTTGGIRKTVSLV